MTPKTLILYTSDENLEAILRDCPNLNTYLSWNTSTDSKKPNYAERLIAFCKTRDILEIYCSNLVALFRGSTSNLLRLLCDLQDTGVTVYILELENISPAGVLQGLRNWELTCKSLAQKESIERARAAGAVVGRPPKSLDVHAMRELRLRGLTYREIGKRLGLDHTIVMRRLGEVQAPGPSPIKTVEKD